MDQPTAEKALKEMERLVGEWALEAIPPSGEPWPGEARAATAWHDSCAHLVQRTTLAVPGAPNATSIMGCDAANGTYYQLYSDDRGVCRVYEMSIGNDEWRLWRTGEPFPQRFTGRFGDDGNTIVGRWEKAEDGKNYETDFDLIYRKINRGAAAPLGGSAVKVVSSQASAQLMSGAADRENRAAWRNQDRLELVQPVLDVTAKFCRMA